jgi:pimeloyl-ACP methyl ester carboxylesterase
MQEPRQPKPRLLLVPQFTELEWGRIRDQLAEWADVASYDAPSVGDEPITPAEIEGVRAGSIRLRDLFVRRGLEEVDRRGWERYFVVGDGYSTATAARIARERADAVQGIALGHASVTYDMDGERPAVRRPVWAAMRQLLSQDHREFIRHGIVQMTRGSVDDELAGRMIDRFPSGEWLERAWDSLSEEQEDIGALLAGYDGPLLLAQHVGCLSFTDEGFADAVSAFPQARTLEVPMAPGASPAFADALRDFCESAG